MKRTSKAFCLLFVVIMLFALSITAFAGNETNDGNIKIEVATNKGSYGATGVAELTATITNVSDKDINNVTAQAVFDDLAPAAKKKSQTSKSVDVLKSGESFSFKYKVTLNEDKHKINFFQKIILWFVRLFNGGYNASNNNIDVVAENVTEIKFDKFTAKNVVQVGYVVVENDNSDNTNDNNNTENDGNEDDNNSSSAQTELLNMAKLNGGKVPDITMNSGIPSFISGKFSDIKVIDIVSAINSLNDIKNLMMIKDVENEFIEKSCSNTQYKLQQIYNNIPVYGCSITITTDAQGNIECLNGRYTPNLNINITPKISETEVVRLLTNEGYSAGESIELVIYAVSGYTPQLAYKIRCNRMVDIFVSAEDGHIISSRSNRTSFSSIGVDLSANIREFETYKKNNNMFLLKDDSRGIIIYSDENLTTPEELDQIEDYDEYLQHATIITSLDNLWNPKAVQAMYSAKNAYDFYRNTVITSAFDNNNLSTINFVIDYSQNYMNAFSDTDPYDLTTTYLCIGDGEDYLNAYDVIYHEFTHSIIAATGGLEYFNESGAINEAYADILGNIIENKEDDGAWLIGEDMSTGATRNLGYPSNSKPPQPECINNKSINALCYENHDHYEAECDNGGVHYNSGIINKAAYLMYKNGISDKIQLAQLFVTSLEYMSENANFFDCRAAVLHSAKILNMESEKIKTIENAFSEVGISENGEIVYDIMGIVTDKETSIPISDVSVTAYSSSVGTYTTTTDKNGQFKLTLQSDFLYKYEFYHENYEKYMFNFFACDGELNVSLTPKKKVNGTVTNKTTGLPIKYASIKVYSIDEPNNLLLYKETDESGNYSFSLPRGEYIIKCYYVYLWDTDIKYNDEEIQLIINNSDCNLDITLTPQDDDSTEDDKIFTGTVLDEATEAPISNVVVNITEQGDSLTNILEMVITDENGNFSLNLPDGDYTLEFLHDDYEMYFAFITIGSDNDCYSFCLTPLETRTITDSGNCGANGDNVTWTLYNDGELVISGSGEMENYTLAKAPWYSLHANISRVTVCDGVTSIGEWAFYYCYSLSSVTIPNTITNIGKNTFDDCYSLVSITIPNSVTNISDGVFLNCKSLTNINIPDSVTSIGNHAFSGCNSLTNIIIPDSVTSIGDYAFNNCDSLIKTNISDSVMSIGDYAFYDCENLANITIPDSVISIGDYTFCGCDSFTSIIIPDSVTSIGNRAFTSCNKLKTIFVDYNNQQYSSDEYGVLFNKDKTILIQCTRDKTKYIVPDSVTSIENYAFCGCDALTNITFPNSVINIGIYAFSGCNNLTNITIPYSITNIGNKAFSNCGLSSITIPDSVTSIGDFAFSDCHSLTSITIPNSVTSIGNNAFSDCTRLKSINIPDSVISIGNGAFADCDSLKNVLLSNNLTYIGYSAFCHCVTLESIIIPSSVTEILSNTFGGCTNLKEINISDDVKEIYYDAFKNTGYYNDLNNWENNALYIGNHLVAAKTTINGEYEIRNTTVSISQQTFKDCSNLTKITIPKGIEVIKRSTFENCTGLISVKIADSVKKIEYKAFDNCPNLKALEMPISAQIVEGSFSECVNIERITLTKGTGVMQDFFLFPGYENIGYEYTPWYLSNGTIKEIVIEEGVTYIGEYAFYNCDKLEKMYIPKTVTEFGYRSFVNTDLLLDVYYSGTEEDWYKIERHFYNGEGGVVIHYNA